MDTHRRGACPHHDVAENTSPSRKHRRRSTSGKVIRTKLVVPLTRLEWYRNAAHSSRFLVREENAARKGGRSLTRNETKRDTHDDSKQAGPLKEPSHTSRSCPCPPPRLRAASSCCASRGRPWRNRGESHHHGARCDITLVQKTGWHEYLCTLVPRECGTNFHARPFRYSSQPLRRTRVRRKEASRRDVLQPTRPNRQARLASQRGLHVGREEDAHGNRMFVHAQFHLASEARSDRFYRCGNGCAGGNRRTGGVLCVAEKEKKRIRLSQIDPASFFYCTALAPNHVEAASQERVIVTPQSGFLVKLDDTPPRSLEAQMRKLLPGKCGAQ
ncbi:hypothetical protein MRX96_041452 [Rhipicephalus microplus]